MEIYVSVGHVKKILKKVVKNGQKQAPKSFEVSFFQSRPPNDQGAGDENPELLKSKNAYLLECLVSDVEVAVPPVLQQSNMPRLYLLQFSEIPLTNLICFRNGHFSTR